MLGCVTAPQAIDVSMSERDFQNLVVELAGYKGWLVMHTRAAINQSGRWSTPIQGDKGYPDLTLAKHGRVIFLELKSKKGRVSPDQKQWIKELPNAYVVRPSDWDLIVNLLAEPAVSRSA